MLCSRAHFHRFCFPKGFPRPRKLSSRLSETLIFAFSLFLFSITRLLQTVPKISSKTIKNQSTMNAKKTSQKSSHVGWMLDRFCLQKWRQNASKMMSKSILDAFGDQDGAKEATRLPPSAILNIFWWIWGGFRKHFGRIVGIKNRRSGTAVISRH